MEDDEFIAWDVPGGGAGIGLNPATYGNKLCASSWIENMRQITPLVIAAFLLSACAGGPRPHTPVVAATPADTAAYQAALEECRAQLDDPNTVLTGAVNVVEGAATTYAVGGVAFAAGAASSGTLAGAASAAGPVMVVTLPLSIYLFSRGSRARQERRIQRQITECMSQRGYQIVGWQRVGRADQPRE
jgi:hypothetical protein